MKKNGNGHRNGQLCITANAFALLAALKRGDMPRFDPVVKSSTDEEARIDGVKVKLVHAMGVEVGGTLYSEASANELKRHGLVDSMLKLRPGVAARFADGHIQSDAALPLIKTKPQPRAAFQPDIVDAHAAD